MNAVNLIVAADAVKKGKEKTTCSSRVRSIGFHQLKLLGLGCFSTAPSPPWRPYTESSQARAIVLLGHSCWIKRKFIVQNHITRFNNIFMEQRFLEKELTSHCSNW